MHPMELRMIELVCRMLVPNYGSWWQLGAGGGSLQQGTAVLEVGTRKGYAHWSRLLLWYGVALLWCIMYVSIGNHFL